MKTRHPQCSTELADPGESRSFIIHAAAGAGGAGGMAGGPVRLALGSKSLRPPADRAPDGNRQPARVVRRGSRRQRSADRGLAGQAEAPVPGGDQRGRADRDAAASGTRVWFHFCVAFRGRFLSLHRTESEVGASDFGVSVTESEQVTRPAAFTLLSVRPVV